MNLSEYSAQFAPRSVYGIDRDGSPSFRSIADANHDGGGEVTLAIRDPKFLSHYFHFIEVFFAGFCLQQEFFPERRVTKIYLGRQKWNNALQNNVQSSLIRAVYPSAHIIHGEACLGDTVSNCIVVSRQSDAVRLHYNKFLEPYWLLGPKHASAFRRLTLGSARATSAQVPAPRESLRAGYVPRVPPRTLKAAVERRLLDMLTREFPSVDRLDFAAMSWADQVVQSNACSLIVGVHGNGLTNAIWTNAGSTLVELFPPRAHHYDYQFLAEIFDLRYFGLEGKSAGGFVATNLARSGPAVGGRFTNRAVEDLPWPLLEYIMASAVS